jgi:hypothetical protein
MNVGILYFRDEPLQVIPALRLRALIAEARLQGVTLTLLNADFFDLDNEQIRAHCWQSENSWVTLPIHIPELVIIQGIAISEEQIRLRKWLVKNRTIIADSGLNKSRLSELVAASTLSEYIIPTLKIDKVNPKQFITRSLHDWGGAVIKRADSNRGIGLLFISENDGLWKLNSERQKLQGSLTEIVQYADRMIAARLKYRDYIIQPFLNSSAKDGRPVDIRAHVQKRRDGKWALTRAYVRVAEADSLLPNFSKGGYQGELLPFLLLHDSLRAEQIKEELISVSIAIAELQDTVAPHPLSELGLDFLLDENSKLWLVETNALPQSALHEMERARHTIGYAIHLYEKHNNQPEKLSSVV